MNNDGYTVRNQYIGLRISIWVKITMTDGHDSIDSIDSIGSIDSVGEIELCRLVLNGVKVLTAIRSYKTLDLLYLRVLVRIRYVPT